MCEGICIRYSENSFEKPYSIFYQDEQDESRGCFGIMKDSAICGVSVAASVYIKNAHDTLMTSGSNTFLKIGGVILLEIANLANTALAVAETVLRVAIAIIALPFYFMADERPQEGSMGAYATVAVKFAAPATAFNIVGGFKQGWDMLTATNQFEPGLEQVSKMVGYDLNLNLD